jgi:hypothetical protein
MATIEDLARIFKTAERASRAKIIRVRMHPEDFSSLSRSEHLIINTNSPDRLSSHSHYTVWGVPIFIDPRNERGIAYVVTSEVDDLRAQGTPYQFALGPEPRRRTAWDALDQDVFGDDP